MKTRHALLAGLMMFAAAPAAAQEFPSRPIRLVIPYPAGGTTDVIARALQEPMRAALGQPIVIDNRGGGSGALGMREVMNAAPDGYTLAFPNNGPAVILPVVDPNIGYRGTAMTAVTRVTRAPLVLVTPASLPPRDLRGLIAYARERPGRLNYGTAGVASLGHIATLLLAQAADFSATHIPYRGQGPMTVAVTAGEVDFVLTSSSTAMNGQIQAGNLRALAVSTADPSPVMPGVPPISTVIPGFSVEIWFGLLAPPNTPAPIVNRIADAVRQGLALPAVQQTLRAAGMEPDGSTPAAYARVLTEEEAMWRTVITRANIRPE